VNAKNNATSTKMALKNLVKIGDLKNIIILYSGSSGFPNQYEVGDFIRFAIAILEYRKTKKTNPTEHPMIMRSHKTLVKTDAYPI
jgi:hypothetical protein